MFQNIFNRTYPYLSIGALEVTKHIDTIQAIGEIVGLSFQFVIGGLTIWKLANELKNKLKKNE